MELIFLQAKKPLCKEISDTGTKPYPLSKNFTSHHHETNPDQKGLVPQPQEPPLKA